MGLKIFFDVDYTLLAMDGSLRPLTKETFEKLLEDGHQIFIWSGVGLRTDDVKRHNLEDMVSGVYKKPIYDFIDGLELLKVPHWPDFVIDDYPEIVDTFGGVLARPYFFRCGDGPHIRNHQRFRRHRRFQKGRIQSRAGRTT